MPSKWQFATLANYRNVIREGAVNKLMWDFNVALTYLKKALLGYYDQFFSGSVDRIPQGKTVQSCSRTTRLVFQITLSSAVLAETQPLASFSGIELRNQLCCGVKISTNSPQSPVCQWVPFALTSLVILSSMISSKQLLCIEYRAEMRLATTQYAWLPD